MIHRLFILQLTVMLLGMGLPSATRAASLFVVGPEDATVQIDGDDFGRLPLSGAIELSEGLYVLRVSHPGYKSYETAVEFLSPDAEVFVEIELLPLEKRVAVVSSLFLAGTGQLYLGRAKLGWSFLTLQLAAVTWAIYAESQFEAASNDYQRATLDYADAIADEDIRAARAAMDSEWSDLESAENSRTAALWSIAGVAVVAALEAWWSFDRLVTPQFDSHLNELGETEFRLGLRGGF